MTIKQQVMINSLKYFVVVALSVLTVGCHNPVDNNNEVVSQPSSVSLDVLAGIQADLWSDTRFDENGKELKSILVEFSKTGSDINKVEDALIKEISLGNQHARVWLARLLLDGVIDVDSADALKGLYIASETGNPDADFYIALAYLNASLGLQKEIETGKSYLFKASHRESILASNMLAEFFLYGMSDLSIDKDFEIGKEYLALGLSKSNLKAKKIYANYFVGSNETNERNKARVYSQDLCELQSLFGSEGCFIVAYDFAVSKNWQHISLKQEKQVVIRNLIEAYGVRPDYKPINALLGIYFEHSDPGPGRGFIWNNKIYEISLLSR